MPRHPKLLGLDIGFGFTKCLDGEQNVILASHLRPWHESPGGDLPIPAGSCRVDLPGGSFLVDRDGRGVSLFSDIARRPERLFDVYAKGLALTAAAVFSEHEAPLDIVVGLPLAAFPQWQARLKDHLMGFHKVGLTPFPGTPARKNIHIRKIHVVPHPLGTYINLIMDRDGRLRKGGDGEKKMALIDIGFRNTDVMVMEAARFCKRGSTTIEMGLADAWETVARALDRQGTSAPDVAGLHQAIRRGRLHIEDQTHDVAALREEAYRRLAGLLADQINHRLRDHWDLERLLLTGGAAPAIAGELAPLLDGEVDLIEHERDGRLSNAQGHLSLARHLWGRSGLCDRVGFT